MSDKVFHKDGYQPVFGISQEGYQPVQMVKKNNGKPASGPTPINTANIIPPKGGTGEVSKK